MYACVRVSDGAVKQYCTMISNVGMLLLQALSNGFFDFDAFDVREYEHYEVWRIVYFSICLSVCLSVCLSICLPDYLSACLSVC